MKINQLEIDDVKRIKAVKLMPTKSGLTIIGGKNNQGKTSVLDSITWALGGEDYRPSNPAREGSATMPYLRVVLDNGVVVERKGKNSSLKVTDPSGKQAGQQLLNSFISKLALDLPKFLESSDKEKAETLLNIIGVGPQLKVLEQKEKEIYNERLTVGRIADQKKKFAEEQPYFPEAPEEPVSASELIRQQQEILARNGQREMWAREHDRIMEQIMNQNAHIDNLKRELADAKVLLEDLLRKKMESEKTPEEMKMESTAELEANIRGIDEINRKVSANLDKDKALEDAKAYTDQYTALSEELDSVRTQKMDLLKGADLPLPGLSVTDGKLTYNGQFWDNMSGSDQLMVSTAIIRKLNPECGFVLVDKLEQMDLDTLNGFGAWAEKEGLQIIGTRVSTGDECSIIIEDGYGSNMPEETAEPAQNWKEGTF